MESTKSKIISYDIECLQIHVIQSPTMKKKYSEHIILEEFKKNLNSEEKLVKKIKSKL